MPMVATNDLLLVSTAGKTDVQSTAVLASQGAAFASISAVWRSVNVTPGTANLTLAVYAEGSNDQAIWKDVGSVSFTNAIANPNQAGKGGTAGLPIGGWQFLRLRHELVPVDPNTTGTVVVSSTLGIT